MGGAAAGDGEVTAEENEGRREVPPTFQPWSVAPPGGKLFPLWADVQKLCNMCVLSSSWNFFVSRQIHCKAVDQRATLIHRQYNRDWGTSYSRPPIDPYLVWQMVRFLQFFGTVG